MKPAFLISFLFLISLIVSSLLPSAVAMGWAWISIAAISIALLILCVSVIFKAGADQRSAWSIMLVAVSGILALTAQFAFLYRWAGLKNSSSGELVDTWFDAFYFSVVTWTTLGYGDLVPTEGARPIAMIEALLGYLVMALLIAAFVSTLARSRA